MTTATFSGSFNDKFAPRVSFSVLAGDQLMLIGHFEGIDGERGIAWRGGGLAGAAAVSAARARRADAGPGEIASDAKTADH